MLPNWRYLFLSTCGLMYQITFLNIFFYWQKFINQTRQLLQEGALNEDVVLDHVNKVVNVVRECNVTLRWLMLHTAALPPGLSKEVFLSLSICTIIFLLNIHSSNFWTAVTDANKRCRQVRDQIISDAKYDPLQVFELLLNTAQFELKFKELFKRVSLILCESIGMLCCQKKRLKFYIFL